MDNVPSSEDANGRAGPQGTLISRRGLVSSTLATAGVLGLGSRAAGRSQEKAPPVFEQMLGSDVPYIGLTEDGPLYPPGGIDLRSDLTSTGNEGSSTDGRLLYLFGHVLDASGAPVSNASVEIWQADVKGNYRHPRGWKQDELDPEFGYFGRVQTDDRGYYQFKTIQPRAYAVLGLRRSAHIHMKMRHPDHGVMTTEAYFDNESHHEFAPNDAVFQSRPEWVRGRVVLPEQSPADFPDLGASFHEGAVCCKYDLAFWL